MSKYTKPAFVAAPVATICSKSGCSSTGTGGGGRASDASTRSISIADIPVLPSDLDMRADRSLLYVFEPEVQLVFEMNATASDFLKLCNGTNTVEQAASSLAQAYGEDHKSVLSDSLKFLVELKATGFRILYT